jgi:4-hydroxybenzoate polyprenyltransferase
MRSIAGLKNIALAAAWTLATVPAEVTLINTTIVLQRFLFILILSLCVDLRDLQQDRSSGISTLTGLFGFNKSKFILFILCACLWLLSFQATAGNPTEAYRMVHTASAALLMLTILMLRDDTKTSTYTLIFDGHLVVFSLALVITTQS